MAALETADVVSGAVDFQLMQGEPVIVPQDASPRQFNFLPAGLGANLAVRHEAFTSIGGFDEELIVGEDIDLCWRLQLSGHRFAYCPEALVHKSERATLADLRRQWFSYGRGDPTLYRRFRKDGMSRNWLLTAKTYAWLVLNAFRTLRPGPGREVWVKVCALRIGRLVGSIDNRVLYL